MKTTRLLIRRLTGAGLHLALGLGLIGSVASTAHAESFSVKVPFAFTAAGKSFPAGSYSVEPLGVGFLYMHGATADETAMIPIAPEGYASTAANPSLSFAGDTDARLLSAVRMDSGMTYTVLSPKRMATASAIPAKGPVALSRP
jgi:hypothetical protein